MAESCSGGIRRSSRQRSRSYFPLELVRLLGFFTKEKIIYFIYYLLRRNLRFEDIAIHAEFESLLDNILLSEICNDEYRCAFCGCGKCSYIFKNINSSHARHHNIKKNHVERLSLNFRQSISTVYGNCDVITGK